MLTKDERIVVDILMERDNLSFDEACDALNDLPHEHFIG